MRIWIAALMLGLSMSQASAGDDPEKLVGQPVDIAPWSYGWRADRAVQERAEAYFIPRRLERIDRVYRTAKEALPPVYELPGGREWEAVIQRAPAEERHLAVHDQHCVALNEADHAAWAAGGHSMLEEVTMSGTQDRVRERLAALAEHGVTEIVFQPCGPDVRRELEVFMATAKTAVAA